MRALLIVSHGSRRQQSNEEVNELAQNLNDLLNGSFEVIHSAFLEIAEPSIPEGIDKCAALGADSIMVLPYFLAAGRHVAEDIPSIVNEARKKYPKISIEISRHIGAFEQMPWLISRELIKPILKEYLT
jgi:sirohydrochlorin ferrochelatase